MKRSPLRWFDDIKRMENQKIVKKVYWSSVKGPNRRGRPLGRWEDRVKEYVRGRRVRGNGLEWARRECMDRERWRYPSAVATPRGDASGGSEASELLID